MSEILAFNTGAALLVLGAMVSSIVIAAAEGDSPPEGMPFRHALGYEQFQENCAGCHGPDLGGTDQGPPLMHGYYKTSHHSDAAFYRAIRVGSPQHHWNFGDMKPVEGVTEQQAKAIVDFVRWYQRENGLF